ncbi:MAG: hypothetical protein AN481_19610, partial [Aphanizomenon flos-aquae LD13]
MAMVSILARGVENVAQGCVRHGVQMAEAPPRRCVIAQDIGRFIRPPGCAPFGDGNRHGQPGLDEAGQDRELDILQRGDPVVALHQRAEPFEPGHGRQMVGCGHGEIVDERGPNHVTEIDETGDVKFRPVVDQNIVRIETVS